LPQVDPARWAQLTNEFNVCLSKCNYGPNSPKVQEQVMNFLRQNPNCLIGVEVVNENG
jgi:hypothetical protein